MGGGAFVDARSKPAIFEGPASIELLQFYLCCCCLALGQAGANVPFERSWKTVQSIRVSILLENTAVEHDARNFQFCFHRTSTSSAWYLHDRNFSCNERVICSLARTSIILLSPSADSWKQSRSPKVVRLLRVIDSSPRCHMLELLAPVAISTSENSASWFWLGGATTHARRTATQGCVELHKRPNHTHVCSHSTFSNCHRGRGAIITIMTMSYLIFCNLDGESPHLRGVLRTDNRPGRYAIFITSVSGVMRTCHLV